MPVYNGEKDLDRTIQSILRQTFRSFEFIIVDDGSTDGTAPILRRWARKDRRIKVLHNRPNQGIVRSLNKGLLAAKAGIIARIDCGDVCGPKRLEAQTAYFQKHPSCLLLGTQVNRVDQAGKVVGWTGHPESEREIRECLFDGKSLIAHPSAMYKKIGGLLYRENAYPAEDYDLWLRLAERGGVAILHERLVDLVNDPASISHKNMVKQIRVVRGLRNALIERLEQGREKTPLPNYRAVHPWRWKAATALYGYKVRGHYYGFHPVNLLLNLMMAVLCPSTLLAKTALVKLPRYLHPSAFQKFMEPAGRP